MFTAGTYGLAWGKLQERYGDAGDIPNTNRYQILFFRKPMEIAVHHRMRNALISDSTWVKDEPSSFSRIITIGDVASPSERPRVFFSVGDGQVLPSGELVRCIALRGSTSQLERVSRVTYRFIGNQHVSDAMTNRASAFLADFRVRPGQEYHIEATIEWDQGVWTESLLFVAR